jgi:hypothetical protein
VFDAISDLGFTYPYDVTDEGDEDEKVDSPGIIYVHIYIYIYIYINTCIN